MPAFSFSFHRPRFLRSHRSTSRHPDVSDPCPDVTISHPHGLNSPGASSPRPPSRLGIPEPNMNTIAPGASHPLGPGNSVDHQNSTEHVLVDRPPDHPSSQPPLASQAVRFGLSNAVPMPSIYGSVTQQHTLLSSPSSHAGTVQAQHVLASQPTPAPITTPLQHSLNSQHMIPGTAGLYSPQQQRQNEGIFNHAHNFTVVGSTFVDGNVTVTNNINTTPSQFMKELLEKTIPGAEFDSSDRDPPPRCHPGTRLAILDRCLNFIRNCSERKIRWVVGAAGVGKSALMQSVAESPELPVSCHASVFFSINGRNDGTKAVITISYQFAAKLEPYRQAIEKEITRDPSLLRSSMGKQFLKLIIEPFIHNPQLNSPGRFLIIIDGLDECNNSRTQVELLRLISDFCIKYPSSPLVWLIASRPETYITSFFSRADVLLAYEKEEIAVDSDEGRRDVERFLRDELMEIKNASDSLDPQWPKEPDLWKLANASGGLFAYAQTAVRYIGDSTIGSPASQLSDVLNVIDNFPMTDVSREDHPMALLDGLYARILSNVPLKIMINTRKLLLALASNWDDELLDGGNFIVQCNWLGMTADEAYAAINHLRSVLYVPRRDKAHLENLRPFHKSFIDYIMDYTRSEFSRDIEDEAQQLKTQCAFRVFEEAPDGIDFGGMDYYAHGGELVRGPGTGDKISLTWSADQKAGWNDDATRLSVYKLAVGEIVLGMERGDLTFQTGFCVRLLTTQLKNHAGFLLLHLLDWAFVESRRQEFIVQGVLKQIALKAVDVPTATGRVRYKFRFCRTVSTATHLSDPWDSSCPHNREGEYEEGKDLDWVTVLLQDECAFCFRRLQDQLKSWRTRFPDHVVPALFISTGDCCVEFRFIDPDDGAEWTYWYWCLFSTEEHAEQYE